jgi:hypothetical protein
MKVGNVEGWNQRKIVERAKTSCEEESLKSGVCSQPPRRKEPTV